MQFEILGVIEKVFAKASCVDCPFYRCKRDSNLTYDETELQTTEAAYNYGMDDSSSRLKEPLDGH